MLHLTHVFFLIVAGLIMVAGYQAVKDLGEQQDQSTLILFKPKLQGDLSSLDYGDVEIKSYTVPADVTKVCFADPKKTNPLLCPNCPRADENPIIRDIIEDGVKENVFLMYGDVPQSIEVESLTVGCCDFQCVKIENGELKMKLEGQGEKTLVQSN